MLLLSRPLKSISQYYYLCYHNPLISFLLFLIFSLSPCTLQSRPIPALVSSISPPSKASIHEDHHNSHTQKYDHKSEKHVGTSTTLDRPPPPPPPRYMIEISDLKRYLHRFGYLQMINKTNLTSNTFDSHLKHALIRYQTTHNLPATGSLTPETLSLITSPRCGVPDTTTSTNPQHTTKHYVYFPGKPRWINPQPQTPLKLTYAFSQQNTINYLTSAQIHSTFHNAFTKWESTIPVQFTHQDDYDAADIKIGFYGGDHGDGEPFDGKLGILGHAFSPEDGRFHLDSDEIWSVDFNVEKSNVAVDLESVVLHEIGHVLGLGHSFNEDAVMFPSLEPRNTKLELTIDDVRGVQALYGSNPNFKIGALLEAETTSSSSDCYTSSRRRLLVSVVWATVSWIVISCMSTTSFSVM